MYHNRTNSRKNIKYFITICSSGPARLSRRQLSHTKFKNCNTIFLFWKNRTPTLCQGTMEIDN